LKNTKKPPRLFYNIQFFYGRIAAPRRPGYPLQYHRAAQARPVVFRSYPLRVFLVNPNPAISAAGRETETLRTPVYHNLNVNVNIRFINSPYTIPWKKRESTTNPTNFYDFSYVRVVRVAVAKFLRPRNMGY
jgi:hypothetical protein